MSTRMFRNVMDVMAWPKLFAAFGVLQATATEYAVKGCAYTYTHTHKDKDGSY